MSSPRSMHIAPPPNVLNAGGWPAALMKLLDTVLPVNDEFDTASCPFGRCIAPPFSAATLPSNNVFDTAQRSKNHPPIAPPSFATALPTNDDPDTIKRPPPRKMAPPIPSGSFTALPTNVEPVTLSVPPPHTVAAAPPPEDIVNPVYCVHFFTKKSSSCTFR